MPQTRQGSEKFVSTYCYQCVAGPDLLKVRVESDAATQVVSNFSTAGIHPAGGKARVKAFGFIQKTYNPHRVLQPMKRTNPKKGETRIRALFRFHGTRRSILWLESCARLITRAGYNHGFALMHVPTCGANRPGGAIKPGWRFS